MSKCYNALITRSQMDYINWLSEKLEISKSCCVDCLLTGLGDFKLCEFYEPHFEYAGLQTIYALEYQRKRVDLCYKVKVYSQKIILFNTSRYIRSVIRFAMERDEEYREVKESQTKLEKEGIIP